MITCFSAQLVPWQSVRAIFPDKNGVLSNIFIFAPEVIDRMLMFNLELCLVSGISSHQIFHESIDIILPELELPYFMVLKVTSTDYLPST